MQEAFSRIFWDKLGQESGFDPSALPTHLAVVSPTEPIRLRYHLSLSVASQAGEQPRIPSLRTIITDGDAQRFLLTDQHEQPLAPRNSCIDKIPLQEHVVLRGERDHDCRELRTLRLVDRDRIG